jgi:3-phytase
MMAVSNRTDQSVDLYRINRDGSLQTIHKQQLLSKLKDEVYGLCMYQSKNTGKYYVFVNDKNGTVEQWELFSIGNKVDGRIIRNLKLASQVEGMVADDEAGALFIGEEDKGIWRFDAEPSGPVDGELISMSGETDNPNIKFDIEGLAIYKLPDGEGYLIASSQGNSSYAFFQRKAPFKYYGSFKIIDGGSTDGSEETDGLDVINFSFGEQYPNGLLVVQDGQNKENGVAAAQNYKIVRWDSIAAKFNPPLK